MTAPVVTMSLRHHQGSFMALACASSRKIHKSQKLVTSRSKYAFRKSGAVFKAEASVTYRCGFILFLQTHDLGIRMKLKAYAPGNLN
jgi:hypothetical protein